MDIVTNPIIVYLGLVLEKQRLLQLQPHPNPKLVGVKEANTKISKLDNHYVMEGRG